VIERAKFVIVGTNSVLVDLIADKMQREGFEVYQFSHFKQALLWTQKRPASQSGILFVAGNTDRHLEDLSFFMSHAHHFALSCVVMPRFSKKKWNFSGYRIDRVYSLPLNLAALAQDSLEHLKNRGIPCMRRFPRKEFSQRILLRLSRSSNYKRVLLKNMSAGGIYVSWSSNDVKEGDQIRFQIHPGDLKTPRIRGLGVVKWVHSESRKLKGLGIEFSQLFSVKPWEIERFLEEAIVKKRDTKKPLKKNPPSASAENTI